jgi:hypothetical protein
VRALPSDELRREFGPILRSKHGAEKHATATVVHIAQVVLIRTSQFMPVVPIATS